MIYYVMCNVGKTKYLLNYWNGTDTHSDNSPFYNVFCFNNKLKLAKKIKQLEKMGYVERGYNYFETHIEERTVIS